MATTTALSGLEEKGWCHSSARLGGRQLHPSFWGLLSHHLRSTPKFLRPVLIKSSGTSALGVLGHQDYVPNKQIRNNTSKEELSLRFKSIYSYIFQSPQNPFFVKVSFPNTSSTVKLLHHNALRRLIEFPAHIR